MGLWLNSFASVEHGGCRRYRELRGTVDARLCIRAIA